MGFEVTFILRKKKSSKAPSGNPKREPLRMEYLSLKELKEKVRMERKVYRQKALEKRLNDEVKHLLDERRRFLLALGSKGLCEKTRALINEGIEANTKRLKEEGWKGEL